MNLSPSIIDNGDPSLQTNLTSVTHLTSLNDDQSLDLGVVGGIFTPISFVTDHDYRNRYLASAFASQAHNFLNQPNERRRAACFLHAVSLHLKNKNSTCFINKTTLARDYAKLSASYNVKALAPSSFNNIFTKFYRSGVLVNTVGRMNGHKKLVINFERLAIEFPAVTNLATANHNTKIRHLNQIALMKAQSFAYEAECQRQTQQEQLTIESLTELTTKSLIEPVDNLCETMNNDGTNSFLAKNDETGRGILEITLKSFISNELQKKAGEFLRNIRSKILSKESEKKEIKKRSINKRGFDFSSFNEDQLTAKRLHESAQSRTITLHQLGELVCLHYKHSVNLSAKFHGYLRYLAHRIVKRDPRQTAAFETFMASFEVMPDGFIKAMATMQQNGAMAA